MSKQKKIRVGVIFGGKSSEHEISLLSAASVIKAMDQEKFEVIKIGITKSGEWLLFDGTSEEIESGSWEAKARNLLKSKPSEYELNIMGTGKSLKNMIDIAFPVLHGPYGEDGTIQGMLEILDIPFGGCTVLGSALAMDKIVAKDLFIKHELPVCKHSVAFREEIISDIIKVILELEKNLKYPMFVKPANMGSSVGMTKVNDYESLKTALEFAAKYDRRLIIEEAVNVRELETGVLGNYDLDVAAVGEIIPGHEFYDYTAKYSDDSGTKLQIPANISKGIEDQIKSIAIKAYKALDCNGFARIDFFLDKDSGKVLINEINTIPGFTKYSMFPSLFKEAGLKYDKLIEKIIDLGFDRHQKKSANLI